MPSSFHDDGCFKFVRGGGQKDEESKSETRSITKASMRLTISNVRQPAPTGAPVWTRVYRWGNRVGTLRKEAPWNERWNVEARRPLAQETVGAHIFLLETAELLPNASLPLVVDDAWEEEILPVAEGATWNRSLTVTGSPEEITRACGAHRIPLSATLLEYLRRVPESRDELPDRPPLLVSRDSAPPLREGGGAHRGGGGARREDRGGGARRGGGPHRGGKRGPTPR
jgi:hypothetical protein